MVSKSSPQRTGDETDTEAAAAIEEVIGDFGARATIAAIIGSSIAKEFDQMGHGADSALRVTQVILRQIAYSENPQLEAEIMALGCGVILSDEMGVRKIAKKWGMTPAAISARVIKFADENGLPPSQYMRSLKDRQIYAMTNQPRVT